MHDFMEVLSVVEQFEAEGQRKDKLSKDAKMDPLCVWYFEHAPKYGNRFFEILGFIRTSERMEEE